MSTEAIKKLVKFSTLYGVGKDKTAALLLTPIDVLERICAAIIKNGSRERVLKKLDAAVNRRIKSK